MEWAKLTIPNVEIRTAYRRENGGKAKLTAGTVTLSKGNALTVGNTA